MSIPAIHSRFLNNKDIYYIAQLHDENEGVSYGIVPVSSQFERVLFVKDGETACFAFSGRAHRPLRRHDFQRQHRD